MNDLIVDVKLWGESVGSLYWEKESNAALFDYERKFIRSGLDISPIIMPISQYRNTPYRFLENRTDCFKGLPGLFADSLPDTFGNQIINEWFASKGLSGEEITPLDRLCLRCSCIRCLSSTIGVCNCRFSLFNRFICLCNETVNRCD